MPSSSEPSWRVLVALLVYNGEKFVGSCLQSLSRLAPAPHTADILVLDDASPAPGWSDRCRELTTELEFGYYRTPRNLGVPRNMNLAMLHAFEAGYDAVILLDADTIVPANLIQTLLRPLLEDPLTSSATAWSNNSGMYSIPMNDPDHLAEKPELIDWLSEQVNTEFDGQTIPIPSGVGFCMAMPTPVINDVGLMDPVFGRGYSQEIDWCLRSQMLGYRSVLVPSCFVYHAGSGITNAEGILGNGDRIVHAHQAIIDDRYPLYRSQLSALSASNIIDDTRERGLRRIILSAARRDGYRLETSRLHWRPGEVDVVRFRIDPDGSFPVITAAYEGFETSFSLGEGGVLPTVEAIVGQPPQEIRIFDRESRSHEIEAEAEQSGSTSVLHRAPYRERVL
jgi:GT2 family glycosyltransferase